MLNKQRWLFFNLILKFKRDKPIAGNELRELDYDPLEYLDQERLATLASAEDGGGQIAGMSAAEVAETESTLGLHEYLAGYFPIVGPIAYKTRT